MRRISILVIIVAGLALPASIAYAVLPGGGGGGGVCDYVYGAMPSNGGTAWAYCDSSFETGWRATMSNPSCSVDKFMGRIYHVNANGSWDQTPRFQYVWCADSAWHWSNIWSYNEKRVGQMVVYCKCAFDMMMIK